MRTFLLCAIVALFLPQNIFAQVIPSIGGLGNAQADISLRLSPERPGPNQSVTATIDSFSTDLNRSTVSWFINGILKQKGIGQKNFTFETGGLGSVQNLLIAVLTVEGGTIQKSITLKPAAVDLVWEANSYTPPFYNGKALFPYQGTLRVVALPQIVGANGKPADPRTLIYSWKENDSVMADYSGYGKQSFSLVGGVPLRAITVAVEVTTVDKASVAENSITVQPIQPRVIFYEDNPLEGILYNHALENPLTLSGEEIQIAAIPYFIEATVRNDFNLQYQWYMNGTPVSPGLNQSSLVFRQTSGVSGTAQVSSQVTNANKLFQFGTNALSVIFGAQAQAPGLLK